MYPNSDFRLGAYRRNSFFVLQSVKSWIEYIDYEMETKFDEGEPILEGGYSKLVDFLTASLTGE